MDEPFPIFVGWDPREEDAYQVCKKSLIRNSSVPLCVRKLDRRKLSWPGDQGIFTRKWAFEDGQRVDALDGKPFSTEFSFTRFLVPVLQQYEGWALFFDCDFLWRGDVAELIALRDDKFAVQVVQHNHTPKESIKMDGCAQTRYYRKNWSSLVLWNCGHPSNLNLTRQTVNTESGSWLHAFQWLHDEEIGALPEEWNWLEGSSDPSIKPKAVHYTRGGPWFPAYSDVIYADEWYRVKHA